MAGLAFVSMICKSQTFIASESDTTAITEYYDGKQWAYRDMGYFLVGLSNCEAKDDYGKYYRIGIFIHNHGELPVTFCPEEITARLSKNDGDSLQLKVYTNEAFQKKIKNSQAWAMALYAFAAGMNAGMAGHYTSHSTSYSQNGYIHTTITHHYDANAASAAIMANTAALMTLGKMMENDRTVKEQGYLKKTTVHPDESIVGYMNVKRKRGKVLTVYVPVDGHVYSFDWDVSRKK